MAGVPARSPSSRAAPAPPRRARGRRTGQEGFSPVRRRKDGVSQVDARSNLDSSSREGLCAGEGGHRAARRENRGRERRERERANTMTLAVFLYSSCGIRYVYYLCGGGGERKGEDWVYGKAGCATFVDLELVPRGMPGHWVCYCIPLMPLQLSGGSDHDPPGRFLGDRPVRGGDMMRGTVVAS